MNSGLDLHDGRSLALLANLKQTCAKYAKLEDQLARELTTHRYAVTRKFREATESTGAKLDAQIAELESFLQHETTRLESIHERRSEWIRRAHEEGIRNLPSRAQGAKERWMGRLQMQHFIAARKMNTAMAEADRAFAACLEEITDQRKILAGLEQRARAYFRGYWTFLRRLQLRPAGLPDPADKSDEPEELLAKFKGLVETADSQLALFRRFLLPRIFSYLPLPILIVLLIGGALLGGHLAYGPGLHPAAGVIAVVLVAAVCGVHFLGLRRSGLATTIGEALAGARRLDEICRAAAVEKIEREHQRITAEFEVASGKINQQWEQSGDVMIDFEKVAREKIEAQLPRLLRKNDILLKPKLIRLQTELSSKLEHLRSNGTGNKVKVTEAHDVEMAAIAADEKRRWDDIAANWHREILPIYREIEEMNGALAGFCAWSPQAVEEWTPPAEFMDATKFGRLEIDLAARDGALPRNPLLALPDPAKVSIPLALSFPDRGSLLFETTDSNGSATVIGTLNNIILRLLSTTPPGKLSFTIIDPVGLGQSFAGLMHLADYEESLISRRIWTQRDQIEERLAELSEHIEKVIQMYLRTEYRTITEYNEQAGSVAEKYHFLVVADFPADFSETAAKRLQSIIASGPRCGVYTLLHWNRRATLPDGFSTDDLKKNSICIRGERNEFTLGKEQTDSGAVLVLDQPPEAGLAFELIQKIGKASVDSNRVEVPFSQVAPKPSELWAGDTTQELRIAIGRTGATKLQYLAIGKGTRQHALFAGKTGSGKSTLFHVIITNLALACSPDQVEFYLIDFKKGVEFKCYASKHLPHAKVVAIESDREFGLSVLQRVDEELKRRGDLFRKLGVQDIASYKRAGGDEPMPRTLLIIDEFQEFFVEDDPIAQTASLLFDRIIRQGRAFGIHVLLGSQTLGGAYSLARATLGQMVIRVALQCNEADAYLIMDDNNSAPRLLSRPGEGIYNDSAGAMEGNSPFQVVWLPDDERDAWLDKVRELAVQHHDAHPGPVVFEGNAPADIRENQALQALLDGTPTGVPPVARCWLGAPNSIKGPTEAVFQPQSGNNLLIVGQREEAAMTLIGISLLALAAQHPVGSARFILFNTAIPNSPEADFMERIAKAIPHKITVAGPQDVARVMNEISSELKARGGEEQSGAASPVFVFIHGLQKFKKLRQEDDFDFSMSGTDSGPKPGPQFNELICEGGGHGMHVIASVDTLNNVNRFMSRKALSEFEMRVAFQMGANDSASLIDSPKASGLGLHRALLYNEHEGSLETFRPYAPPDAEWLSQVAEKLARMTKESVKAAGFASKNG